ncbi:MAG: XRE family transcriptional regulator [Prevotella sp.]|nr:XRE family transcriptional regulator [Prevotella sp.]
MIHIGQIIKKQVAETGKTTVWLSQQLGCHRTNLYKIYEKPTIDTGMLMRISRALNHDFFSYYSDALIERERKEENKARKGEM